LEGWKCCFLKGIERGFRVRGMGKWRTMNIVKKQGADKKNASNLLLEAF